MAKKLETADAPQVDVVFVINKKEVNMMYTHSTKTKQMELL